MAKAGLDKEAVIKKAAEIADRDGLDSLSMRVLAQELGIRSPSLYNHIGSLDELKHELMLYGWRDMEHRLLVSAVGVSGYDALRAMCRAFLDFALEKPGVFDAMLWYNKYSDADSMNATEGFFRYFYRFTESVNISRYYAEHILRTMRGFLEGFSLLVNNGAFGHSASIEESFDISLEILIAGIKTLEGK